MSKTIIVDLQVFALTLFAVVMAVAAFEDFRRLVIPNLLPILLCVVWPVYFAAAPSLVGALAAIGCAIAVFLAGAVLFAFGKLGAGDVKLLAAAALWAGPNVAMLLLLTAVLGGALALLWLIPFGRQLITATRALLASSVPTEGGLSAPIPYGVSIACAAFIVVILSPYFG
jgi:prepilin peptidase CpaA